MDDIPAAAKRSLQIWAKVIAINVRNRMESFHCKHLTDEQMAVLNPIIRNAIYGSLRDLYRARMGTGDDQKFGVAGVAHAVSNIPAYWEDPVTSPETLEKEQAIDPAKMGFLSTAESRVAIQEFLAEHLHVFSG